MRKLLLVCVLFAGCESATVGPPETFAPDDSQYKLALLIDMSGSFETFMADNGKAYEFLLQVIDSYFRDTIGSNNKVIIAQTSARNPFLIYEGTPQQLRDEYDPQKFAALLREHANPNGSPIHEAVATTLEYLLSDPSVAAGKAKPIFFVLSDMDDNFEKTPELKSRILRAFDKYGKLDGAFGIYYCDQRLVIPWREVLNKYGIRRSQVEASIVARLTLPNFD